MRRVQHTLSCDTRAAGSVSIIACRPGIPRSNRNGVPYSGLAGGHADRIREVERKTNRNPYMKDVRLRYQRHCGPVKKFTACFRRFLTNFQNFPIPYGLNAAGSADCGRKPYVIGQIALKTSLLKRMWQFLQRGILRPSATCCPLSTISLRKQFGSYVRATALGGVFGVSIERTRKLGE